MEPNNCPEWRKLYNRQYTGASCHLPAQLSWALHSSEKTETCNQVINPLLLLMSQDMIWKITVIVLSLARSFKIGGFYFYLLIKGQCYFVPSVQVVSHPTNLVMIMQWSCKMLHHHRPCHSVTRCHLETAGYWMLWWVLSGSWWQGGGPLTQLRTSISLGAISPLSRVTSVTSLAPASLFTARSFSQFVLRAITGKCRVQWAVYLWQS